MLSWNSRMRRMAAVATPFALLTGMVAGAEPQQRTPASPNTAKEQKIPAILDRDEAGQLMPGSVFFGGHSSTVQERNSSGVRLGSGTLVLAALVDSSGYSSGMTQRYQAYLLTQTNMNFAGHVLGVGAYGCGIVGGEFVVMNIAGAVLFQVPSAHDAVMHRPIPLQFVAMSAPGDYRLYEGRDYVSFTLTSQPSMKR